MFIKKLYGLTGFAFGTLRQDVAGAGDNKIGRSRRFLESLSELDSSKERTIGLAKNFNLTLGQRYRHGFEPEELVDAHPLVKRAFSLNNATDIEITAFRIKQAIKKYQKWSLDTASPIVKAAVLNERVISSVIHMDKNYRDKKGLLLFTELIHQRRIAMQYLRLHDYNGYKWLLKDYGLKEFNNSNHDYMKHTHNSTTKTKRPQRIETNRGRWVLK